MRTPIYLLLKFYSRIRNIVDTKMKQLAGQNVNVMNASMFHPVSTVAKSFGFFALSSGENVVPDVFFCNDCGEYVVNNPKDGTNPFIRHQKVCSKLFAQFSTDNFASFVTEVIGFTGVILEKGDVLNALMKVGCINNEKMYVFKVFVWSM